MKTHVRAFLLLALAAPIFAAGNVQQTLSQLGKSDSVYVLAFRWEGDGSTGSVPTTNAQLQNCCAGYLITQVQTVPLSPSPTSGYAVAIKDPAGFDALDGAAASLSATDPESFAAASSSPPLQGTFSLVITGQSVAGAKGVVYVYLVKPGVFNALNLTRGVGSGASNSANWLTLANTPFVDARRYNYTAQTPGGSLSAGACSFRMSPVPTGLITGGSVYISGGTGTAEALTSVTVSGSTVSGTCAYSHSGAWNVRSASAGMKEAAATLPANGGMVFLPPGTYNTYAPVDISAWYVFIQGSGIGNTIISPSAGTYDVFTFPSGSQGGLRDVTIRTSLGRAGGYGVSASSRNGLELSRIAIDSMPNGFHITSGNQNVLRDVFVGEHTGDGILVDGANGFVLRVDRALIGSSQTATSGLHMKESGDAIISDSHFLLCTHGILVDPGSGQTVASLELNSVYADTSIIDGIRIAPATGGMVYRARLNSVWASGTTVGEGMVITSSGGGVVDGVQIVNAQIYGNARTGLYIDGAAGVSDVSISNSHIGANSFTSSGTYSGALINASAWQFVNNVSGVLDGFAANTQSVGLQVFPGANDNYVITGNDFRNNVSGALSDGGTGANKIIRDNLGVDDATPGTIASAATVALPTTGGSVFYVTGTTALATVNGGWKGRTVTLQFTDSAPGGVTTGGNIYTAKSAAQNAAVSMTYDGTKWIVL